MAFRTIDKAVIHIVSGKYVNSLGLATEFGFGARFSLRSSALRA